MLDILTHPGIPKAQLFYYLTLQGKDVDTMHLWGMGSAGRCMSPARDS